MHEKIGEMAESKKKPTGTTRGVPSGAKPAAKSGAAPVRKTAAKPTPKNVRKTPAEVAKKPAALNSQPKKAAPVAEQKHPTKKETQSKVAAKPRRLKRSVVMALATYLLAAGGVVLTTNFAWQMWGVNAVSSNKQLSVADSLGDKWANLPVTHYKEGEVPVFQGKPVLYEAFAKMYVPRLGHDWVRAIGEGVSVKNVLDKMGVGHYPSTELPGQLGNFAVAAHRTTYGAAFDDLDKMKPGDFVYLETVDGWYTYKVTGHKIVWPTDVDVIASVPRHPDEVPTERYFTMTTCTPRHTAQKRLVVFSKFVGFTERASGAPAEIAHFFVKK